jgi:glucose-1-phosphate thymidylyltransferase
MKALILSGGKGSRLYPLTFTQAKQLIPIANKPVLFYAIEMLAAAGIADIGIVVGDRQKDIQHAVGDGSQFGPGIHIQYIFQEQPLGLAHAVKVAQTFLQQENFVLFLGDNFFEDDIRTWVEEFDHPDNTWHARLVLKWVENPEQFGVAHLARADGQLLPPSLSVCDSSDVQIVAVEEKPPAPTSHWAIVGLYFFDHHIFEAIDAIQPAANQELEITDAIQYLLKKHYSIRPYILRRYWVDTGKATNLLDANHTILHRLQGKIDSSAQIDETSRIYGEVILEEQVCLHNTVVYGPAIIGAHATLCNARIEPFTSIGRHSTIEESEIEESIIMEGCHISHVEGKIKNSILGREIVVQGSVTEQKTYQLLLGDRCDVNL